MDRVISTVDSEARRASKTVRRHQDSFKAHVAAEPDTGLMTDWPKLGRPAPAERQGRSPRALYPGLGEPTHDLGPWLGYLGRNDRVGDGEAAGTQLRPDWLLERQRRAEPVLVSGAATCYLLAVSTRRVDRLVQVHGAVTMRRLSADVAAVTLG